MADQFLLDQITETETIIININTAINVLLSGKHQSYELNTGQTSQRVTRLNIDELRKMRTAYITERDDLRSACGLNSSVITVLPGY